MNRVIGLESLLLTMLAPAIVLGADAEPRTLNGHEGSVLSVAFSPNGTVLASCSRDKTIKLWHVASGKLKRTLTDHAADVYSVTFSPKGDLLASGSGDKSIKLWDARTYQVVRTMEGH